MSFFEDLQNIDPNNPGVWPLPVKLVVLVAVFLVIVFLGWKFDVTNQKEALVALELKEKEKLDVLKIKQKKAVRLAELKEQMAEMQATFGDLLQQLPDKTEVAGLLIDISQTGLAAGLEFRLFEPQAEQSTEFYNTLPIKISVSGQYHQFGEFVSSIASLPRIVTVHDIQIAHNKDEEVKGLVMDAVARTYRAADEEDEEN